MAQVFPYTVLPADFANGNTNWGTTAFYVCLLKTSAVRNAAHATVSAALGSDEISASGYARVAVVPSEPTAANPSVCDATDVAFAAMASGQTVGSWLLCRRVGGTINTSVDIPYYWYDNLDTAPSGYPTNGLGMTVQVNVNGFFTVTAS